jgi:hypothetical protein
MKSEQADLPNPCFEEEEEEEEMTRAPFNCFLLNTVTSSCLTFQITAVFLIVPKIM